MCCTKTHPAWTFRPKIVSSGHIFLIYARYSLYCIMYTVFVYVLHYSTELTTVKYYYFTQVNSQSPSAITTPCMIYIMVNTLVHASWEKRT